NGIDYTFTYKLLSDDNGKKTYEYTCDSKARTITIMPSGNIFMEKSAEDPFDDHVMMEIINYIRTH
ncbi:MAG TPA: hypothetical protein VMZ03_09660, partial [Chitinophagaceae bacterium]|nr:hypothetical protein [Chitinophagaceae bacterium]